MPTMFCVTPLWHVVGPQCYLLGSNHPAALLHSTACGPASGSGLAVSGASAAALLPARRSNEAIGRMPLGQQLLLRAVLSTGDGLQAMQVPASPQGLLSCAFLPATAAPGRAMYLSPHAQSVFCLSSV